MLKIKNGRTLRNCYGAASRRASYQKVSIMKVQERSTAELRNGPLNDSERLVRFATNS